MGNTQSIAEDGGGLIEGCCRPDGDDGDMCMVVSRPPKNLAHVPVASPNAMRECAACMASALPVPRACDEAGIRQALRAHPELVGDEWSPPAKDHRGNTLLHLAVQARDLVAVRLLLEAGIETDVENDEGMTATQLAVAIPSAAMVRQIGAAPKRKRRSVGPLRAPPAFTVRGRPPNAGTPKPPPVAIFRSQPRAAAPAAAAHAPPADQDVTAAGRSRSPVGRTASSGSVGRTASDRGKGGSPLGRTPSSGNFGRTASGGRGESFDRAVASDIVGGGGAAPGRSPSAPRPPPEPGVIYAPEEDQEEHRRAVMDRYLAQKNQFRKAHVVEMARMMEEATAPGTKAGTQLRIAQIERMAKAQAAYNAELHRDQHGNWEDEGSHYSLLVKTEGAKNIKKALTRRGPGGALTSGGAHEAALAGTLQASEDPELAFRKLRQANLFDTSHSPTVTLRDQVGLTKAAGFLCKARHPREVVPHDRREADNWKGGGGKPLSLGLKIPKNEFTTGQARFESSECRPRHDVYSTPR